MSVTVRTNVFVSYSHNDESFLVELLEHLRPFERTGSVSKWSDKDVTPGSNRFDDLKTALTTTRVAVLLVSSSFLASDFINEHELGPLLKEAETGGVRILWIHVRACSWKATPLKNYQAAISPEPPLAEMNAERDKAWVKICQSIGEALDSNSHSSLRKLVHSILITSSDFDAFCINYFPDVYRHFAREVDRGGKLNLLLALGDASRIRSCLREAYPERADFFARQQGGLRPKEQQRLESAARLKELLRKRAILIEYNSDTTLIDSEIDRERKALRQGPRVKKGEVLSECYQLIQKINQGAYGEIWLARDLRLDTDIAIKILHGKWNDREEIVTRFAEVANQVASILHPHVISVLSPAIEWEEFHYYVMEYLAGGDLHHAVVRDRDHRRKRNFLDKLSQVGDALTCLHSKGLVHRDIKPQNILLDAEGAAKISDFDLLGGDVLKRSTETGEARGTFLYAAPEQFGNAAHADARADIHALGRTALFIIYGGDLPVQAGDDRVHFIELLPIASNLKKILLRATEPDPAMRFPTVAEFCKGLEASLLIPDALSPSLEIVSAKKFTGQSFDEATALTLMSDLENLSTIPDLSVVSSVELPVPRFQSHSLPSNLPRSQQSQPSIKRFIQVLFLAKRTSYVTIAVISTLIFSMYAFTKYIANNRLHQPNGGTIPIKPTEPEKKVLPVSITVSALPIEHPIDKVVNSSIDLANDDVAKKVSKEEQPKNKSPKSRVPKSDLLVLQQAIPKLKNCLIMPAGAEIVNMIVVMKIITTNRNEVAITNGVSYKIQCMKEVFSNMIFPAGETGRIFTATYSFSSIGFDNVKISDNSFHKQTPAKK